MNNFDQKINEDFPIDLLQRFDSYFKKRKNKAIVNIDRLLKKNTFDFQIQRFEDAVRIFGGNIPPNRFSHFYIAILTAGQGIKTTGLTEFEVRPNTIIFIPSGVIHSSHSFTADTKGFILSFSEEFVLLNHTNKNFLKNLLFFQLENQPYIYVNENDADILLKVFQDIATEYLNYKENNEQLLQLYILELLIKTERIYKQQVTQLTNTNDSSVRLVTEFKKLLEANFLHEKTVSSFAEQLAVHPNHLNATIKKITGRTCSELIHRRILLEAKCLLKSSELSIKEIAAYLSFEDSSYFSKYFKKMTKFSPLEYREQDNL